MVRHNIFRQTELERKWFIPILANQTFVGVDGLFDEADKATSVDYSVSQDNDNIILDFGFDSYAGSVRYSYIDNSRLEVENTSIVKLEGNMNDSIRILEKLKIYDKGVERIGYKPVEASVLYVDEEIRIEFNKPFTGVILKF